MIRLLPLPTPSSSSLIHQALDFPRLKPSTTAIRSSSSSGYIPKLEPFSRSKIDRWFKEPSLIEKTETQLADYCSTLEGDASYSCWNAYLELKHLEEDLTKEEVEHLIRETQGVKSLIECVHGVSSTRRKMSQTRNQKELSECDGESGIGKRHVVIPDGLPKTREEVEEEEEGRMPDSAYTRMLRSKGKLPAWYSQLPDHETD